MKESLSVTSLLRIAALLAVVAGAGLVLPAPAADAPDEKDVKALVDRAYDYLKEKQPENGGFSPRFGPGVPALVVTALVRNGYSTTDPVVKKSLAYLTSRVKKDGGIYDKRMANYTTSVAVMALKEANTDGKYDAILKNAAAFLKTLQFEDPANKDIRLGGVGYDKGDKRVDMSNTHLFVEALIAAGVPKDDPAVVRAMKFISRCQNFPDKEKGNDLEFAKKAKPEDRGGFTYRNYRPDPDDPIHKTGDGGLRSLGAMTYAGLKTFLYAGVKKDDPRVQGAIRWIRQHYTLDENPGEKQAGLYYYYHTFAKAMEALGEDPFKDAKGNEHHWRKELFEALKKRQQDNGSFVSKGDEQFGESDPNLATAFALLSLSYARGKK
jgi:squalene-hopene/tetraprenyl-beta-curcumene cyclase